METNFELADRFEHLLWLDSDRPLLVDGTAKASPLRTEIRDAALRARPSIEVSRAGVPAEVWTDDPTDLTWIIRQSIKARKLTRPGRIAIVIDGSGGMSAHLRKLGDALKKRGFGGADTAIFFAGEEVATWKGDRSEKKAAGDWVRGTWWDADGGRDRSRGGAG